MTDKEAMAMALDALENIIDAVYVNSELEAIAVKHANVVITTLKERLTQEKALQALHNENERLGLYRDAYAEQEPVGTVVRWVDGSLIHGWFGDPPPEGTLLYAHPPQLEERNFCSRCGKRTKDLTHIHTCTPPQENT